MVICGNTCAYFFIGNFLPRKVPTNLSPLKTCHSLYILSSRACPNLLFKSPPLGRSLLSFSRLTTQQSSPLDPTNNVSFRAHAINYKIQIGIAKIAKRHTQKLTLPGAALAATLTPYSPSSRENFLAYTPVHFPSL